jgi:site-specific DNA-cytosine methylase
MGSDAKMKNSEKIILDLCGGTGAWSKPYQEAGYDVRLIDLPEDVRLLEFKKDIQIWGILAAPPCTIFSYARQRYGLPKEHELISALSVVDACIRAVYIYNPRFWVLENPRNKLRKYLGEPRIVFKQWWYGDGQEKPTCLYGNFKIPDYDPGKRTKKSTFKTSTQNSHKKDAITSPSFAKAFFKANR